MKRDRDLPYEVRQVPMRTCAQLYRKWRNTRFRYRNAPVNGIDVQVEYVDVFPLKRDSSSPSPLTALCLHGAPGSHQDFRHLIGHLTSKNIRVIAPNFPGKQEEEKKKKTVAEDVSSLKFIGSFQIPADDQLIRIPVKFFQRVWEQII